jgi:hypothetical protein
MTMCKAPLVLGCSRRADVPYAETFEVAFSSLTATYRST